VRSTAVARCHSWAVLTRGKNLSTVIHSALEKVNAAAATTEEADSQRQTSRHTGRCPVSRTVRLIPDCTDIDQLSTDTMDHPRRGRLISNSKYHIRERDECLLLYLRDDDEC